MSDLYNRLLHHELEHDNPECRLCMIVRAIHDQDMDAVERLLGLLGEGEWVNREEEPGE